MLLNFYKILNIFCSLPCMLNIIIYIYIIIIIFKNIF